jgi:hypothetical protein
MSLPFITAALKGQGQFFCFYHLENPTICHASPFQGDDNLLDYANPGRCPGLLCVALSGQRFHHVKPAKIFSYQTSNSTDNDYVEW